MSFTHFLINTAEHKPIKTYIDAVLVESVPARVHLLRLIVGHLLQAYHTQALKMTGLNNTEQSFLKDVFQNSLPLCFPEHSLDLI